MDRIKALHVRKLPDLGAEIWWSILLVLHCSPTAHMTVNSQSSSTKVCIFPKENWAVVQR